MNLGTCGSTSRDGYACCEPAGHKTSPHIARGVEQQEICRWPLVPCLSCHEEEALFRWSKGRKPGDQLCSRCWNLECADHEEIGGEA